MKRTVGAATCESHRNESARTGKPDSGLADWLLYLEAEWLERRGSLSDQIWSDVQREEPVSEQRAAVVEQIAHRFGPSLLDDLVGAYHAFRGIPACPIDGWPLALLENTVKHGVRGLKPSQSETRGCTTGMRPLRWLAPCVGGGLCGIWLAGGGLMALLGAAGGIAAVAMLSQRPEVLVYSLWRVADGPTPSDHANLSPSVPTLWRNPTGRILNSIRRAGLRAAARVVDYVLEPESAGKITPVEVASLLERAIAYAATLVFVVVEFRGWMPTAQAAPESGVPTDDHSVLRALGVLIRALDGEPANANQLRECAEELQQRLQDAGYRWERISDGTAFRADDASRFLPLGLIEPGQPVTTLEPCLCRDGEVLMMGRLTRQRG